MQSPLRSVKLFFVWLINKLWPDLLRINEIIMSEKALEDRRRRLTLVVFASVGIPIAFGFSMYHRIAGDPAIANQNLLLSCFLLAAVLVSRVADRWIFVFRICILVVCLHFLRQLTFYVVDGSLLLWLYTFPVIAFFLLGRREGMLWTGLLLCGTIWILFFPDESFHPYPYSFQMKIRFLITYIIVGFLTFIIESIRSLFHRGMMDSRNQLHQTVLALKASMATIEETKEQLVQTEKMAALGSLVAGVSHEINTPIGVCLTAASFLDDRIKEFDGRFQQGAVKRSDFDSFLSTVRESAALVLANLNRASELIGNFKQVAVDQTAEDSRPFNVKAYIQSTLISLKPILGKTRHNVHVEGPDNLVMNSYPGVLSQVLTNLISNSLIHGFEGVASGSIEILFKEKDGSHLVLKYSDNGRGISEADLGQIYDPFFTTKRSAGGTGLGMHIVYNLITQKLSGQILCQSLPGQGLDVEIIVPLTS